LIGGFHGIESPQVYLRDVALLPGELVTHVFSPDLGLSDEPPEAGPVLITTNRRILAFTERDGHIETFLTYVEELRGAAVKAGSRRGGSVLQGLLLAAGGIFLYVTFAYWLTGRVGGPSIPILNMDVGPFILLTVAVLSAAFAGRYYWGKGEGSVTFRGSNWTFVFPYRGERAGEEIYRVVNTLFSARDSSVGYSLLWKD
tara:strand:- start:1065 stop:1664 length:600 start_codon:yes stop_codon:yes gene_type:complete